MKKYICIALVVVIALFVVAMIISGSDEQDIIQFVELNEGDVEKVSFVSSAEEPSVNHAEQKLRLIELPRNSDFNVEQIIWHKGYSLSFNPNTLIPNWVAYELTSDETDGPWTRKGLRFMPDPDCQSMQADNDDYRNSGYSRGHLAPAGDMKWDSVAMLESFYFTNCIPQDEALNNGRWNQLEMKARTWAKEYGCVYVVCGPVFFNSDTLRIGYHQVAVPDACFKALLAPTVKGYSAIAFLMNNADEKRSIADCALTVDELENCLGMDFFYALDDNLEEETEAVVKWNDWGLSRPM